MAEIEDIIRRFQTRLTEEQQKIAENQATQDPRRQPGGNHYVRWSNQG